MVPIIFILKNTKSKYKLPKTLSSGIAINVIILKSTNTVPVKPDPTKYIVINSPPIMLAIATLVFYQTALKKPKTAINPSITPNPCIIVKKAKTLFNFNTI